MPSISPWRNDGGGSSCSLVEVLERGALPRRFFLSSKACRGILRRAEERGRALPEALRIALEAQANADGFLEISQDDADILEDLTADEPALGETGQLDL